MPVCGIERRPKHAIKQALSICCCLMTFMFMITFPLASNNVLRCVYVVIKYLRMYTIDKYSTSDRFCATKPWMLHETMFAGTDRWLQANMAAVLLLPSTKWLFSLTLLVHLPISWVYMHSNQKSFHLVELKASFNIRSFIWFLSFQIKPKTYTSDEINLFHVDSFIIECYPSRISLCSLIKLLGRVGRTSTRHCFWILILKNNRT